MMNLKSSRRCKSGGGGWGGLGYGVELENVLVCVSLLHTVKLCFHQKTVVSRSSKFRWLLPLFKAEIGVNLQAHRFSSSSQSSRSRREKPSPSSVFRSFRRKRYSRMRRIPESVGIHYEIELAPRILAIRGSDKATCEISQYPSSVIPAFIMIKAHRTASRMSSADLFMIEFMQSWKKKTK